MISQVFSTLRRRRNLVRWAVVIVTLIMIGIYEWLVQTGMLGARGQAWEAPVFFSLAFLGIVTFFFVDRTHHLVEEREALKERLALRETLLEEALQRQNSILRISQMFLDVNHEDEIVELTLRLARELLGARGASFVPLDENAQPLNAQSLGEIPFTDAGAWLEYLASPGVRDACAACQNTEQLMHTCPLLVETFHATRSVYCIPLRREGLEFGVLNLFMPEAAILDAGAQAMLRTLVSETTIALESVRMRQKAMLTIQQLQSLREKTDLNGLLKGLMVSLLDTLEADAVLASISDEGSVQEVHAGVEIPAKARHLMDGILQSVTVSREPVLLENAAGKLASSTGLHAILAAPLIDRQGDADTPALGAILAASRRPRAFNQRQLSILQMIAGQVALVVQNVRLVAQLEYKTMIEERMRLAREIHDGLAQTLGFLKLKTAQMRTYVDQDETGLLQEAVDTCYDVLSEAYQDARQAIDGLRLSSNDGFGEWLQQTVEEFRDYTGIVVSVCEPDMASNLPPEVNAQLIRIVQEALSNIRKHARARQVEIACRLAGGDLVLEICDDGIGFNVEDVPGPSQHGLRGMRERAELIGADLQVTSRPGTGTVVRLRLPLHEGEKQP